MARGLSTTQRIAVRAVADQATTPLGDTNVQLRTLRSLVTRRILRQNAATGGWELTAHGRDWHASIMRSGDGPEDLKARLNVAFGGGARW